MPTTSIKCRCCHRRFRASTYTTHLNEVHQGNHLRCPLCEAPGRGLDGLHDHMEQKHGSRPVTRQVLRCRDVDELACLAANPRAWPYGFKGSDESPLVGRLIATMEENGIQRTTPQDLETTLNTTLNTTFCHGVVCSSVVRPAPDQASESTPEPKVPRLDEEPEQAGEVGDEGDVRSEGSPSWNDTLHCEIGDPLHCSTPLPTCSGAEAKAAAADPMEISSVASHGSVPRYSPGPADPEQLLPEYHPTPLSLPILSLADTMQWLFNNIVTSPPIPAALPSHVEDPGHNMRELRKRYPAGFLERVPHGVYPSVAQAKFDWAVAGARLPVVPEGDCTLEWPLQGWLTLSPEERPGEHLKLAALLEAGWYGGDSQLSRWDRHAKYAAFELPGAARLSLRGATEAQVAKAQAREQQRWLERISRRSGQWEMSVLLRLPAEVATPFQLPQVLQEVLKSFPQVPQPWDPRP